MNSVSIIMSLGKLRILPLSGKPPGRIPSIVKFRSNRLIGDPCGDPSSNLYSSSSFHVSVVFSCYEVRQQYVKAVYGHSKLIKSFSVFSIYTCPNSFWYVVKFLILFSFFTAFFVYLTFSSASIVDILWANPHWLLASCLFGAKKIQSVV